MSPVASVLPVEFAPATASPVLMPVRVFSQWPEPVVPHEFVVDDREGLAGFDSGADGAGVVLMQGRESEDGDERVAGELFQRAAVAGDDRRNLAEIA